MPFNTKKRRGKKPLDPPLDPLSLEESTSIQQLQQIASMISDLESTKEKFFTQYQGREDCEEFQENITKIRETESKLIQIYQELAPFKAKETVESIKAIPSQKAQPLAEILEFSPIHYEEIKPLITP